MILAGLAVAGVALVLARLALLVVRVDGPSMVPTFQPGDAVLTVRRQLRRRVRRGDVVVCRRPAGRPGPDSYLIKRVVAIAGDPTPPGDERAGELIGPGQVYVRGDSDRSLDSRIFGPIPLDHVIGHVVARLTPGRTALSVEERNE